MKFIIYNPASDPNRPSSPFLPAEALSSPINFYRTINRNIDRRKTNNTIEVPESEMVTFTPGLNRNVKEENWAFVQEHNKGSQLVNVGALRSIEPDIDEGQVPNGMLTDFTTNKAMDIVKHCYDIEWLTDNLPLLTNNTTLLNIVKGRIKSLKNDTQPPA
jgi:hypothetical protein